MSVRYHFVLSFVSWLFAGSLLLSSCHTGRGLNRANRQVRQAFKEVLLFNRDFSAFVLYDIAGEEQLVNINGNKHFTPASNTKIATLLTALTFLGDSLPILAYTMQNDSLYFKGTGNPLNLNPHFKDNRQLIEFLSRQLSPLVYIPPSPEPIKYGSGWAWDDYLYSYQLEMSALPIYGNELRLKMKDGLLMADPSGFLDSIEIQHGKETKLEREFNSNRLVLLSHGGDWERSLPFHTSDYLIVKLLTEELGRKIELGTGYPEGDRWLFYQIAFPDSLYIRLMQESDNFIAEQLLLLCAGKQSDTLKTSIALRNARESFADFLPDTIRWVDGSGLSRYNLFTPVSLVRLLNEIYRIQGFEWIKSIFARGGESGTIEDWYFPYIYAKTGTLSNNHNLSGFLVAKSGRVLIFSFMHNHFMGSSKKYKEEMDKFLENIYNNY